MIDIFLRESETVNIDIKISHRALKNFHTAVVKVITNISARQFPNKIFKQNETVKFKSNMCGRYLCIPLINYL